MGGATKSFREEEAAADVRDQKKGEKKSLYH